ncbi:DUF4124 domain-containing protein [Moritella sp. 24]|uniref:DUF4124 domain-containing protein n=1 Tax=Moritella sp. 24 TaxID=2746230 RepID=UPI001BA61AE6|nr:DUF4124 domain-containing protein [Moritella sp. 24]QUM77843.1 DUF4124 domain-containing protein [Moritella sp. 24]
MMLNSIGNYKRLILALVCGSMSYSTFAKVYSWRDADGAMHYSQFPRQIVEKNAAQSRASRQQADMNDVVNDLAVTKGNNLLDGLDDIVANANVERQVEKVLTRRDPQLVLIEQQLARQQAEQRALTIAKQDAIAKEKALVVANNMTELNQKPTKQKRPVNSFMAGIHKRAYGSVTKAGDLAQPIVPSTLASTQVQTLSVIEHVEPTRKRQDSNKFLAQIQNKLKRNKQIEITPVPKVMKTIDIANAKSLESPKIESRAKAIQQPEANYILDPVEASMVSSAMVAVNTPLVEQAEQVGVLPTITEPHAVVDVASQTQVKPNNAFLAGIKKKLNRSDNVDRVSDAVVLASKTKAISIKPQVTQEQVQNKFLAEINKKLFRAKLGSDVTPTTTHVKTVQTTRTKASHTTTAKNKALMQSADQIKAIESEISSSSDESHKVKSPAVKQVSSALMLSRLSYNSNARLPLLGAGTNQLDRQGIEASSQFVNEVNRSAE